MSTSPIIGRYDASGNLIGLIPDNAPSHTPHVPPNTLRDVNNNPAGLVDPATGLPVAVSIAYDSSGNPLIPSGSMAALGASGLLYYGQAATRCKLPTAIDTANKQARGRRTHTSQANYSKGRWQIVVPNFYQVIGSIGSPGVGEAGPGAPLSVTAAIEYPIGATLTQVTFGGSATGTAADKSFVVSDGISLAIPKGERFIVHLFQSCSGGLVTQTGPEGQLASTVYNDATQKAASGLTDTTMVLGQAIANTTGGTGVGCCAILSWTTAPSVFMAGDSIVNGTGDGAYPQNSYPAAENAYGALGVFERALVTQCGYIIAAMPGEFACNIALGIGTSYYANRLALSKYCSHVIGEWGVNDFNGGRTTANMAADVATIANAFGQPVYWSTSTPCGVTSTDNYTTYANQTAGTGNANRIAFNQLLRTHQIGALSGFFDVCSVLEQGRDSGKWITYQNARVVADGSATNTKVISSATAAFTPADLGQSIMVSSSAFNQAYIVDVAANGGSATINQYLPTGTGLTVTIGYKNATADGNHPGQCAVNVPASTGVLNISRLR